MSETKKSYNIENTVANALAEDIGSGDVTAQLIPEDHQSNATLISRDPGVLCGAEWFNQSFSQLDSKIVIQWNFKDGDQISANSALCTIHGNTRVLLTAERTALNLLQTLSGTATVTQQYAALIAHTNTRILDTRKTIPGLRLAQKYAVGCGGGRNHRIGLYDAILIKENHIIAAGSILHAIRNMRKQFPELKIETEVENLDELEQALDAGVDRVLLDNFDLALLRQAVEFNGSYYDNTNNSIADSDNLTASHNNSTTPSGNKTELEASGNVTLDTIKHIAETGVDFISIGAITKHLHALDLSLRIN